ncbi:hypothetical protein F5884DRAFT_669617 [Xylogone sp. PMI_703]|nr:hypothetical protein F5884DRAFT_669617 [Xylogone sp. PMI_703]
MSSLASKTTITLLLTCALVGGYGCMFTAYRHGFFDALGACTAGSPGLCILDMSHSPASPQKHYTGIAPIDNLINVLLEFFAHGLRSQADTSGFDLEALLAFTYIAAQFGGAWYLIALEGLRRGNAGSILSFTGAFGILIQTVTITIIAPLYLILQILSSPSVSLQNAVLVDPTDLAILPIATTISYFLPTIALSLPLLNVLSQKGNYIAIALWQPFPLYQSIVHAGLRLVYGDSSAKSNKAAQTNPRSYKKKFHSAYRFILFLTMGVHLLVVGTIVASAFTEMLPTISGTNVLALSSLTNPPTLRLQDPPVSAMDSRLMVLSFLRWDVYCACASLMIWAVYQLHQVHGSSKLLMTSCKVIFWTVLGGLVTPAVMLLRERDDEVLEKIGLFEREGKRK